MYPIQYGPILQATRMPIQSRTKSSQSMGAVASFIPESTNRNRNSTSPKFWQNMGQKLSQPVKIEGGVSPGFETVKEMFENNLRRGAEDSAQLCVYVGEEKVGDLCNLGMS